MQFNETSYFLSKMGMKKAVYTVLGTITAEEEPETTSKETEIVIDEKWNDVMEEFFDDVARTCATEMKNNGIPAPSTIGFEFEGLAEAEMAWEDRKTVWLLPEQEEYVDVFKNAGWKVLYSNEEITLSTFGGDASEQ